MTKSQKNTIDWYREETEKFNKIIRQTTLPDGTIEVVTEKSTFIVGKRGGITLKN
jgi:hypothetical protein